MNGRLIISFLTLWALVLLGSIGSGGCANIIPPLGGPRDSLPPVLVKAAPRDSTLNFTGNRISLTFDEYVDYNNEGSSVIFSPVPQSTPNITRKLETINIRLRDTLEPNTTYTINFGRTIKDINEGNPYVDYTYVFSTGTYFDSLEYTGTVLLAQTGEVDTTVRVMLHRNGIDSSVVKEKPRYVAKVDKQGNYHFRNLAPGTYYLYALKDESGQYRYFGGDQTFGFADSAVVIGQRNRRDTIFAYALPKQEISRSSTETVAERSASDRRLKFSSSLQEDKQDLLSGLTFTFELPLKNFDSTKVQFSSDSAYNPITSHHWVLDSTKTKLTLNYAWKESTLYHLILQKDFATDSLGFQLLRMDTLDFTSRRNADYGKLTIKFRNLDLSKNPVLQFVKSNEVRRSFPLTSVNFTQPLFMPGEYNLRILEDRNKNGIWDPGDFFGKRIQPELVKPVSRKLNVKANQDIPIEIDVTAPPIKDVQPGFGPGSQRNEPTQQAPQRTLPIQGGRTR